MKNAYVLEELCEPYYNQFQQLGEIREDYGLPYSFFKKSSRIFYRNFFFELKFLFKIERKITRKEYKRQKKELKRLYENGFAPPEPPLPPPPPVEQSTELVVKE